MENNPTFAETKSLFDNSDPDEVWNKTSDIVKRISPAYDFSIAKTTFDDVVRLFLGEYPGYAPIRTPYHNLSHTLDVVMCSVRLMHGVHISGTLLDDNEITIIVMAALMHDVGYVQRQGEETGTGAQFTKNHVIRGIEFMQLYIANMHLPHSWATPLKFIILCTDPAIAISEINFPDKRARLLGQIVATADLTGQMADRAYLEKLLFLYLEFKEAHFGNYKNIQDLLNKTRQFYSIIRKKLDGELGGIYTKLAFHFKDLFGADRNYYLESIEKNIAYLSDITALEEQKYLVMLKRGDIVKEAEKLAASENIV